MPHQFLVTYKYFINSLSVSQTTVYDVLLDQHVKKQD